MGKVRELRKARGMSVEQLAADSGVSFSTLKNIERGRGLRVSTARKIATALRVTLDELLAEDEVAS